MFSFSFLGLLSPLKNKKVYYALFVPFVLILLTNNE